MIEQTTNYWSMPVANILNSLATTASGLSAAQVEQRISEYGLNRLKAKKKTGIGRLLLGQFKSPIILILIFAAVLSFFLHDRSDSIIILCIVLVSAECWDSGRKKARRFWRH